MQCIGVSIVQHYCIVLYYDYYNPGNRFRFEIQSNLYAQQRDETKCPYYGGRVCTEFCVWCVRDKEVSVSRGSAVAPFNRTCNQDRMKLHPLLVSVFNWPLQKLRKTEH